ncbi:hypothetical protein [Thermococcus henrietii]|uniref:hypothetical protein n=1 Tax=Thermococcus henrietii TaxID=2016361 RepID=UPI000C07FB63|nr:hypothetical protein [Thermococcus henrietii]
MVIGHFLLIPHFSQALRWRAKLIGVSRRNRRRSASICREGVRKYAAEIPRTGTAVASAQVILASF